MGQSAAPRALGHMRRSLDEAEVHLWWAELDQPAPELARLASVLTAADLARAGQFRSPTDRRRWTAARAILRCLLSEYTGQPPQTVSLESGPGGKPRLADRTVEFNLSHAGAVGLYAIARDRAVGVDVERVRADFPTESVASLIFSPAELAAWQAQPPAERVPAFFELWTRKEAYAKARGEGLALALTAKTLGWQAEFQDDDWAVAPLEARPGYAAAVAASGWGWRISLWRWPAGGVSALRGLV